jgi:MFS transporter, DHA2 family, multidrug resistance protein
MSSATTASGAGDDDFVPRGGVFGFFIMVVGMFMAILDIQIVASSLPEIQSGVAASRDQITWVQTGYLVAEVVMIPLSGWLARVMSSRWLYTASAAGFTISSIMCAFAWDSTSLITMRVIQGFVGGAMIPTVFAANFKLFPPEKQMLGNVVIGLTATMAPAIGPTLGGYITSHFSWHWLFLINILPGLIVTFSVPFLIDIDRPNWALLRKIDIIGILLVAGFLGSLEFVLDEGPRDDWFDSSTILTFTIISATSAVLLIWRELTIEHPVLELHTFKNRNFTVGCLLTFIIGMCLYGQSYILPQLLSMVRGYNSLQIGEVMFVTGVAMFCTAPLAGRLAAKVDPRRILFFGFLMVSGGLYLNSLMTPEVDFDQLLWPQILRGSGLILCMVPITAAALGTLDKNLLSGGSGLFNLFRNMGGAVGLAMVNTQWDGRYDRHYWWMVETAERGDPVTSQYFNGIEQHMESLSAMVADPTDAARAVMVQEISRQATLMAWNDVFFMMSILFLFTVPLVMLFAKPKQTNVAAH